MEPGHEDREYMWPNGMTPIRNVASMEPGHEDREYADVTPSLSASSWPQWSPVMKTGNTLALTRPDTWGAGSLNGARS